MKTPAISASSEPSTAGASTKAGESSSRPATINMGAVGASLALDVQTLGATGDGQTLDSPAINAAIDAVAAAGGGTVYVPPGVYRCGTVVLKSNVTLYLEAGATILGSADLVDYTPQPGPPPEGDANERHLIFARDAENVTIAGPGRIDGQGPTYWYNRGRTPPTDDWGDVATYDYHFRPRPSPMLEFYQCTNLHIRDVQIENSPGWTLRPMACTNVFIHGITIRNPIHGPNCDGIDPTSCENLTISDCHIITADDAICLKSEDMYGGPVRVSRNILITNCYLSGCCNGIKFGTATFGGYENVTISNCVIASSDGPMKERVIAGLAIEMVDGGYIDGVTVSNIRMQRVRAPIFIRLGARHVPVDRSDDHEGKGQSFLRGVMISNLHATGATMTSSITGLPGSSVQDITLSDIHIDTDEAARYPDPSAKAMIRPVPEATRDYPEARMFGRLPAGGLYMRHVRGVRLRGTAFDTGPNDTRPTVFADDVHNIDIDGLSATPIANGGSVVHLVDTRHAFIRGIVAPQGCDALVRVEGKQSARIAITGCDLTDARVPFEAAVGVPANAVKAAANITR